MITGFRSIVVKFAAFALVSALLAVVLLNTMFNGVRGDSLGYTAEFADVAGLRVGDDVRVAGVRVGRVEGIRVVEGGAEVALQVKADQPLLDTTKIVMRYQNLLGQRYLALVQGADRGSRLAAGATIPLARTSPGFDLTELLNGFRPLFEALRPDDVNALATSLVKVLQGEGGTVESLLAQTGRLTNFLADRDQVVGEVLDNLTPVLVDLAGRGTELQSTVAELEALMTGLARDRKSIGASIDGMSQLAAAAGGEGAHGPRGEEVPHCDGHVHGQQAAVRRGDRVVRLDPGRARAGELVRERREHLPLLGDHRRRQRPGQPQRQRQRAVVGGVPMSERSERIIQHSSPRASCAPAAKRGRA